MPNSHMLRMPGSTASDPSGAAESDLLSRWLGGGDRGALGALLERHWARAYRVALAIVRDPEAAEDCAQEASLLVLSGRARFGGEGSFGAWLAGTVANVARHAARSEDRRTSRERLAAGLAEARADGAAPADGALLREEIDDRLAALPDDLRAALVLHFYGGCTHREVALALGCPTGTASSRIRLGLERLREAFGRGGLRVTAGGAAAILTDHAEAAVAPPAPLADLLAAVSEASLRRAGLWSIRRAGAVAGVVAAAAAALVVAVLLLPDRSGARQDKHDTSVAASTGIGAEEAPHATRRAPPPATTPAALAGALEAPAPGTREGGARAAAAPPPHATAPSSVAPAAAPPPGAAPRLEGRALDPEGRPVGEAVVVAWALADPARGLPAFESEAPTDALGRFSLEAPAGRAARVEAWHLRLGGARAGPLEAGREVALRFGAPATGALEGTVTDERGAPLEAATLHIATGPLFGREGPEPPVRLGVDLRARPEGGALALGPDGRFRLELAEGRYHLLFEAPGRLRTDAHGGFALPIEVAAGRASEVRVRLPRLGAIAGRLLPPVGVEAGTVAAAFVAQKGERASPWHEPTAIGSLAPRRVEVALGPGGGYRLPLPPGIDWEVRFELPGGASSEAIAVRLEPAEERVADLRFDRERAPPVVAGRLVLRESGAPVAGARLVLRRLGESEGPAARTDALGAFSFSGEDALREGARLFLDHAPYPRAGWPLPADPGARLSLTIEVEPAASITLAVAAASGEAPARLQLWLIPGYRRPAEHPLADPADAVRWVEVGAEARFESLPAGPYFIHAPGFDVEPKGLTLEPGGDHRAHIEVRPSEVEGPR
jgi:RNA polymerase sigma-70 factor (ECF subfamily)